MADPSEIPAQNDDYSSIMQMLTQLFGSEQNTGTGSSSPEALAGLQQLFPLLLQQFQSQDFSPENAAKDSQGLVDQVLKQAAEFGLPNINQAENASGGYGGTTAALLKNDLTARAAGEAAAKVAATKQQYGQARNSQALALIAAINSMVNANRQQSTTSKNPGLLGNPNAQKAAALAAIMSLLKKAQGKDAKGAKPSANSQNNKNAPQDKGTQNSGKTSDADTLNEMASKMGYGEEGAPTTSGYTETSEQLAARTGIDAQAVADRVDVASDPNYDPYDFMGPNGTSSPGGFGDESAGLDMSNPFDLTDLGSTDNLFGDESAGLDMSNPFDSGSDSGSDVSDNSDFDFSELGTFDAGNEGIGDLADFSFGSDFSFDDGSGGL